MVTLTQVSPSSWPGDGAPVASLVDFTTSDPQLSCLALSSDLSVFTWPGSPNAYFVEATEPGNCANAYFVSSLPHEVLAASRVRELRMEHRATSTLVRPPAFEAEEEFDTSATPRRNGHQPQAPSSVPLTQTHRVVRSPDAPRFLTEGKTIFFIAFGIYLIIAVLLDFKYKVYPGDAFSRMANGFYIIYSSDPHLAAIGFVWEPLQSLADMVVLLGNHLWPALSHDEFSGSLVSSLAMAGAAYQMCAALREWGVTRVPRLVLTAFFALDPMIAYYAGNGMSESLYLFTLITSTRYLLRWMRDRDLRSLAYSATALAFCYLTRNEAATAALMGGVAVGLVTYWRAKGSRADRAKRGASDLLIFGAPAFIAALGWSICSYVIIGAFIDGGALQVRLAHQQGLGGTLFHRVCYETDAILALAPFLAVLLVVAGVIALVRRDPRILAPIGIIGGSLGFDTFSYLSNSIDAALRYWIAVVPLGVFLLGAVIAAIQTPRPSRGGTPPQIQTRAASPSLGALFAFCLVVLVMIPTVVMTGSGLVNPNIGVEESAQIGFIFKPHDKSLTPRAVYPFTEALDAYLATLHLPDNDVLVDNADSTGCVAQMVVMSPQPKVFVIPNDRDFQRVLADPIAFHVRYLLVPDPKTLSEPGELNTTYPDLWKTGSGFSKLVHQFPGGRSACPDFRLFHVIKHTNTLS